MSSSKSSRANRNQNPNSANGSGGAPRNQGARKPGGFLAGFRNAVRNIRNRGARRPGQ